MVLAGSMVGRLRARWPPRGRSGDGPEARNQLEVGRKGTCPACSFTYSGTACGRGSGQLVGRTPILPALAPPSTVNAAPLM